MVESHNDVSTSKGDEIVGRLYQTTISEAITI
jgi:hypothetical protein